MKTLASDHAACAALLSRSKSSFALPIRLLPAEKRRATTALYAFCRRADDIVDGEESTLRTEASATQAAAALDAFELDLETTLAGGRSDDPVIRATVDSVRRFAIPPCYLREVLAGVRMDLHSVGIADVAGLELYCSRVASAVGLAAIHIWGCTSPEAIPAGRLCGLAFQLTNILRDIPEDRARGRVYLPESDFAVTGCSAEELRTGKIGPDFGKLAALEVARADEWFRGARRLDRLLSTDGRIVFRAMYGVYRTIWNSLHASGPLIFVRRVSPPKPLLVAAALVSVATGPRGLWLPATPLRRPIP